MKKFLLFPSIFILLFGSCKEESPTEPDNNNSAEHTQEIGVSGGKIEFEDLIINIPANSFSASHTIKISSSTINNTLFSNLLSEIYTISGIPDEFSAPIEIQLKANTPQSGEATIAIGEEIFSKKENTLTTRYRFIESENADGFVKANLPVPENSAGKINRPYKTTQGTINIPVMVAARVNSYTTSQGHFKLEVEGSGISEASLHKLGTYFEEAYSYYLNLGFNYSKRTNWPFTVTIKDMSNFGEYSNSIFGHNYGFIELDKNGVINIDTDAETRRTAGHEFFHFVQSLYDPRNAYSRAKSASDWYWLDEASGTWSEQKFSSISNYVSNNTAINRDRPLEGLQKDASNDARAHGYGMATFINYLTDTYGESILVNIYEHIRSGSSALDAIFIAANSSNELVKTFFTGYFAGTLRGAPGFPYWWTAAQNKHIISSQNDVPKIYSNISLPDYGASYYRVEVTKPDVFENESLKATCNQSGVFVAAFKNISGATTFLGIQESQYIIKNIKELKDQNARIIFAVINLNPSANYTGTKNVDLTIDIEKKPYDLLYLSINFGINVRETSKTDPNDTKDGYGSFSSFVHGKGVYTDSVFTVKVDTVWADGGIAKQEVTIVFNKSLTKIINMKLVDNGGYAQGGTNNFSWTERSLELENISGGQTDILQYRFNLEGSVVCSHLKNVTYNHENDNYIVTRLSEVCNEYMYVTVSLFQSISN